MEFLEVESSGGARERLAFRLDEPRGGGAPLVVLYLHGFGSRQDGEKATYFRARALEAGWAFCSFDFRGHGESGGSMRELTFSRNLADVAAMRALLERRGFARVALFGSSMGGATALWHLARNPDGAVGAALIAPAIGMLGGLERWAGADGLERWRREGTIRYASATGETELGWQLVEDARAYRREELVATYRTPTVILQGQLDATVDWREVAELARQLEPGLVELQLFPDGEHRLTDRLDLLWSAAAHHLRGQLRH